MINIDRKKRYLTCQFNVVSRAPVSGDPGGGAGVDGPRHPGQERHHHAHPPQPNRLRD